MWWRGGAVALRWRGKRVRARMVAKARGCEATLVRQCACDQVAAACKVGLLLLALEYVLPVWSAMQWFEYASPAYVAADRGLSDSAFM